MKLYSPIYYQIKQALSVITLPVLIYVPFSASAAEHNHQIQTEFSLETGLEYDSKLTIVELDQLKDESDTAVKLAAKAKLNWQPTDKLAGKVSYSYSDKAYQTYDEFDLSIQQLSGELGYDFSVAKLGAYYVLADAELADKSFLSLEQTSVFASKLINNRHYLRAAVNFSEKELDDFAGRNSDGTGYSLDYFLFLNQAKSYWSAGVWKDEQDAQLNEFDYQENGLKGAFSHGFSAVGFEQNLQLGIHYLTRDYQYVTPLIGETRNDSRRILKASWKINFNDYLGLKTQLEQASYQSNLASADYNEQLASVHLIATF